MHPFLKTGQSQDWHKVKPAEIAARTREKTPETEGLLAVGGYYKASLLKRCGPLR